MTQGQADALDSRYDLKSVAGPRINAFTALLYTFGALLVGCGVIAFVAAQWEGIPDLVKVVGLLLIMVLFQGAGYHWYKHGPWPLRGHALLVVGAVFFGANVGLFGQIFPTGGHWSSGFGLWALACTLISYGTGSVPIALLGLMASVVCYFGGLDENIVRGPFPVLIGLQTIPFGLKWRSRTTLYIGLALLAATMGVGSLLHSGGVLALTAVLVCGMVYALMGFTLSLQERLKGMARVFQISAALCVGFGLFLGSSALMYNIFIDLDKPLSYERGFAPLLTGLFGILALIWLGPTLRSLSRAPEQVPFLLVMFITPLVFVFAALGGDDFLATSATAIALVAAGLAMCWHGLQQHDKWFYGLGVLLLGSRLILFFLLFSTGLLGKAMFLVLGGLAVIVVALQFEKWAARVAAATEAERV